MWNKRPLIGIPINRLSNLAFLRHWRNYPHHRVLSIFSYLAVKKILIKQRFCTVGVNTKSKLKVCYCLFYHVFVQRGTVM